MASTGAAASSTLPTAGRQGAPAAAPAAGGGGGGGWKVDDFEVGPPVGKGRFGNVYQGRDKASGRLVCMYVVRAWLCKRLGIEW